MNTELTEEDIQKQLSSEDTKFRYFKGKQLGRWTGGLRDLTLKVLRPDSDTEDFHDAAMLYVLRAAGKEKPDTIVATDEQWSRIVRRDLIRETDDLDSFRTDMNLWLDDWTAEDREEARKICSEILTLAEASQVTTVGAEKKREADALPMTTPLSPVSSENP